jgi:uncharacterized membrane protein YgdD (TMEM256/DUF423 family)
MVAALLGAAGVALGAFGAHGLRAFFEANPGRQSSYETAVLYHLVHSAALLGAGLLGMASPSRWAQAAGVLFTLGIVLFSGSLYALALTGTSLFGALAPVGGLSLIAAWLCTGLGAARIDRRQ